MSYMQIWHFCAKVVKFRKRNKTKQDKTRQNRRKQDKIGKSSPWKGYGYEGVLKEISGSICAISTLYMSYWRGFLYSNPSFKLLRTLYLAVRSLYLADFKDYTTATETTTVLLFTQLLSSRLLRIKFAFVEGFVTRMWLPGSCFTAGCKPGREQNRYRWCGNLVACTHLATSDLVCSVIVTTPNYKAYTNSIFHWLEPRYSLTPS